MTSQGYASTDLINQLLGKLKDDTNTYKRNIKASLSIQQQSKAAYDVLVGLIKEIVEFDFKATPTFAAGHWEKYENSHAGITGLERYLLDLLFEDHKLEKTLLATKNVADALTFASTWKVHSDVVVDNAEKLDKLVFDTAKLSKETERAEFTKQLLTGQRDDHLETVETISTALAAPDIEPKDADLKADVVACVKVVKEKVAALTAEMKKTPAKLGFVENKAVGTVVAGVMLLHIPFLINQDSDISAKTDEYFKSLTVWEAAQLFSEQLLTYFTTLQTDEASLKTLNDQYATFKKVLEAQIDLGPWVPQILHMMHLSANVRRPFYGRSVAFVGIWYEMNSTSDQLKDENGKAERKTLRKAFETTIDAIEKAKTEVTSFDVDVASVDASYTAAFDVVKTMIDKYAKDKKEALEKRYTSATETDKKHLEDFKKKTTFLKAAEASSSDE